MEPGLYNEMGRLIKPWAELERLGLDVERSYADRNHFNSSISKASSAFNVFRNNLLSGKLVLPEIKQVGSCAFSFCEAIDTIVLPETINIIEYGVFDNCKGLEMAVLPNTVESIGESAFAGCDNLKIVNVPKGVKDIKMNAFCGAGFEFIELEAVTAIRKSAFAYCKKMHAVLLPNTLQRIEDKAFYKCESLTSITIPANVKYLGSGIFDSCPNLKAIHVGSETLSKNPKFKREYLALIKPLPLDKLIDSKKKLYPKPAPVKKDPGLSK